MSIDGGWLNLHLLTQNYLSDFTVEDREGRFVLCASVRTASSSDVRPSIHTWEEAGWIINMTVHISPFIIRQITGFYLPIMNGITILFIILRFLSRNFLQIPVTSCSFGPWSLSPRKAATYIQDNANTEWTQTSIHASSGVITHEDSPCLRTRSHCDRHNNQIP
jgi:hypothetical protein